MCAAMTLVLILGGTAPAGARMVGPAKACGNPNADATGPDIATQLGGCSRRGHRSVIVFDRNVPGTVNHAIWSMKRNGSDKTRLTNDETVDDRNPTCSRFANRIAFERGGFNSQGNFESDIWVMHSNGSGQVNLTPSTPGNDGDPAWTPDGSKIAFASARANGTAEIYVMNANGTNPTRLTFNVGIVDSSPTWSPDGTKIAFSSGPFEGPGDFDIWVMNADGTGLTRLTTDAADDWYPTWSPDGTRIAWSRIGDAPSGQAPRSRLWVMAPDGSAQALFDPGLSFFKQLAASWCPDARHLAIVGGTEFATGIWRIGPSGSIPTQLTGQTNRDFFPDCGG